MKYPRDAIARIDLDLKQGIAPLPSDVTQVVTYAKAARQALADFEVAQ